MADATAMTATPSGARRARCAACRAARRRADLARACARATALGCLAFGLFVAAAAAQTLLPGLRGALSMTLVFGGMTGAALLLPLGGLLRVAAARAADDARAPRPRAPSAEPDALPVPYRGAAGCPAHPRL
jgi:hypothetical protein